MAVYVGLLSGLLWGVNNALIAQAGELAPALPFLPFAFAACNDLCAAATLLAVMAARGMWRDVFSCIRTAGGRRVLLAALVGGPIGQTAYFLGISMAGATPALLVTALYPIVGCVLARCVLLQQITGRMWGGIFLSVAGAMLVCGGGGLDARHSETFLWGIAFALLAAFAWGGEIVLALSGMETVEPETAVTV